MTPKRQASLKFFAKLKWIDGSPLLDHIEPYRRKIFTAVLDTVDTEGRLRYDQALLGRAKKNFKTTDLVLAALYRLVGYDSPGGNQCYILANDEDQAADDLALAKKLIAANPLLQERLTVRQKDIERVDGKGFLKILPAGDIAGTHGKTYVFVGYDEIHGQTSWDLFEALAPDPTRLDAQQWITSYATIHHRPGIPLYDMFTRGQAGSDPRMYFSWYASDYTTDPTLRAPAVTPEQRANPSLASFTPGYLAQQQLRLPAHKYRRLHLNLPGAPEGSTFQPESVMDAIERSLSRRPLEPGVRAVAFCDHSHGSIDDATLAVGWKDADERLVVACVVKQGPPPPFNMVEVIPRFAAILREYHVSEVTGDAVGGETYRQAWRDEGIEYRVSQKTTSEIYETLEPLLNSHRVVLPDVPMLEQQLLGLVWKGGKITHPANQHDDFATSASGVVDLLATPGSRFAPSSWSYTTSAAEQAAAFWAGRQNPRPPSRSQAEEDRRHLVRCQDPLVCENHASHTRAQPAPVPVPPSQVIDDDRGIHRVSTPTGQSSTYRDPRGLEAPGSDPYVQCLGCGARFPSSFQEQHLTGSERCRVRDKGFA